MAPRNKTCKCTNCPVYSETSFSALSFRSLDKIEQVKKTIRVESKTLKALPEAQSGIICVSQGVLAVHGRGKDKDVVGYFGPGSQFGWDSFFLQGNRDAVSLRGPGSYCLIPFSVLKVCHTEIHARVLHQLIQAMNCYKFRVDVLLKKRVRQRIVFALDYLLTIGPEVSWTRREIGEVANTTTETAIRELNSLISEEMLEYRSGKWKIKDRTLLTT